MIEFPASIWYLIIVCNSGFRDSNKLFCPLRVRQACGPLTYMQAKHIHEKKRCISFKKSHFMSTYLTIIRLQD